METQNDKMSMFNSAFPYHDNLVASPPHEWEHQSQFALLWSIFHDMERVNCAIALPRNVPLTRVESACSPPMRYKEPCIVMPRDDVTQPMGKQLAFVTTLLVMTSWVDWWRWCWLKVELSCQGRWGFETLNIHLNTFSSHRI